MSLSWVFAVVKTSQEEDRRNPPMESSASRKGVSAHEEAVASPC